MVKTNEKPNKTGKTKILGHRGARAEFTENSQSGFAHTQKIQGIAGVEFDVQITVDGQLLVFHDDNLNRLANHQGQLDQLTAKQAKKIFKAHTGQHLLTLSELLPYLANYQHIELEIKTHPRTNHRRLIHALTPCLSLSEFTQLPITLTSFDSRLLSLISYHATLAKQPRGLLVEGNSSQPAAIMTTAIITTALRLGCVQIGLQEKLIDSRFIDLCKRYNLQTTAWTVNDFNRAKQLIEMGIDTLITDYPTAMLHHFTQ